MADFDIQGAKFNVGDELPFGYNKEIDTGDGVLTLNWLCDHDANNKIVSVAYPGTDHTTKERQTRYLDTLEEAIEIRDSLIKDGWVESDAPEIAMTQEGTDKPLNRKQRRKLQRMIRLKAKSDLKRMGKK